MGQNEYKDSLVVAAISSMSELQKKVYDELGIGMTYTFSEDREYYSVEILGSVIKHSIHGDSPKIVAERIFKTAQELASHVTKQNVASTEDDLDSSIVKAFEVSTKSGIKLFIGLYYDEKTKTFFSRAQFGDVSQTITSNVSFGECMCGVNSFVNSAIEQIEKKKREQEIESNILALQQELEKLKE